MISGITRYTKGGFNQAALDEVWNKGKEQHKGEDLPSSGVLSNTIQTLADDMILDNDRAVSNMTSSYRQFHRGVNDTLLVHSSWANEWKKVNLWVEIGECHGEGDWTNCKAGTLGGNTSNTVVEMSFGNMWKLEGKGNNNWIQVITNKTNGIGAGVINAGKDRDGVGCDCCPTPINTLWDSYPNFETSQWGEAGNGIVYPDRCETRKSLDGRFLCNPQHGRRYVGGPSGNPSIDVNTLEGLYGCIWFRLVKLDSNGVDDRHLSRAQVILSSDAKRDDGTTIDWQNVGSMSRHKLVPQNGDWMPINFVIYRDEIVSVGKLAANPPPFPTSPYQG